MPRRRVAERVRTLVNAGRRAMGLGAGGPAVAGDDLGSLADAYARADDAAEIRSLLERVTFGAVAWANLASHGRSVADLSPEEAAVLSRSIESVPEGAKGQVALATLAAQAIAGVEHVTSSSFDQALHDLLTKPPALSGTGAGTPQSIPGLWRRAGRQRSRLAPRRTRGG